MSEITCRFCENQLNSIEYNLDKSRTIYTNTLLVDFIHNFIDNNFFTINEANNNICKICYDLLNELDNIELRGNSIRTQFTEYLNSKSDSSQLTVGLENYNENNTLIIETLNEVPIESNVKIIQIKTENNKLLETCTVCSLLISCNEMKNHMENEHSDVSVEHLSNFVDIKNELLTENNEENNDELLESKLDQIKPFACKSCPKTWKTASELKAHLSTHKSERPFICEICGDGYKRESALAIHVGMHKGINPFTCVYCNKSFTQKIALVRHMPIHTGELRYQCDLCGRRFIHRTSFNMHRLSHTGKKSYKCEVCGLALMSCSHLKRHMRVHTGEKNYCCNICGKRFAEKYNLVSHEKLHSSANTSNKTAKRKYRCQICDNTFDRKLKLDEHLSNDHQTIKMENELLRPDLLEVYNINT